MWAQWQGQDLAPSDEDILTFHDFLPKHFRNTRHIFETACSFMRILQPSVLTKSVNPQTETAYFWNRSPEWIFFGSDGFVEFVWTTETGGGGAWIQTGYTTPNSSGRKYQVFNFSISGFVFKWPKNVYMNRNRWRCSIVTITEATQPQRRRQRERQKSNELRLVFLYIFLCRHCSTKTWKSLISPFMEDVNTKQRYSFCFCSAVAWGGAGGRAWPSPNNFDRHV